MNPSTGSFISMDSYTGSIYDPASLHRYTYVKDNPVMYRDPSGYIAQSFGEAAIVTGIKGVLDNIVQINALAILNGITNAFVSNLMGDSFSTQMKEFVKGFLCGFGLYSFAYFINAIYAISVLEILVVDVLAREASSAVMIVVSACDGDSSSAVKYEIMAMMYALSAVLLYRGTLPKNDMNPSKNGYSWKNTEDGSGAVDNVTKKTKPDFIVTPKGTVMDTSKNYNLVGSGEQGDWFQIHNFGKLEDGFEFPHTHSPQVNTDGIHISIKRIVSDTTAEDIDYADELLKLGKMIIRKGGR